jgi:hypothetical protein
MRIKQDYLDKYGTKAGSIIFRLLQKEAAHARWKAHYLRKLKQRWTRLKKAGLIHKSVTFKQ